MTMTSYYKQTNFDSVYKNKILVWRKTTWKVSFTTVRKNAEKTGTEA